MIRLAAPGDIIVGSDPKDVLVAYGLGSCVALVVYVKNACLGVMAHIVLPGSCAKQNMPHARYSDNAIDSVVGILAQHEYGLKHASVRLVGGAKTLPGLGIDVGAQNVKAVTRALHSLGACAVAGDTGGYRSRTAELVLSSGMLRVYSSGAPTKFL